MKPSAAERSKFAAEAARVAAAWWTQRLRDGVGIGDNGDRAPHSLMARALTHLNRDAIAPASKADAFERALVEVIEKRFALTSPSEPGSFLDSEGWDVGGVGVELDVDYDPNAPLYEALRAAGFERLDMGSVLPLKTNMAVSPRLIVLKFGYAAERRTIWGPQWGPSREEADGYNRARYAEASKLFDMWEATIEQRLGPKWTYAMVDEAGLPRRPDAYNWQGPVREVSHGR